MDIEKKKAIIHDLTEFVIATVGVIVFLILMCFKEFNLSYNLNFNWIFLFNTLLLFYWLWKRNSKFWEKSFVILY
jgi:hypothetical protein